MINFARPLYESAIKCLAPLFNGFNLASTVYIGTECLSMELPLNHNIKLTESSFQCEPLQAILTLLPIGAL